VSRCSFWAGWDMLGFMSLIERPRAASTKKRGTNFQITGEAQPQDMARDYSVSPILDGVYVDHGEAYGNLGEEAMILSALTRLETHFGPRRIYITRWADEPMPTSGHPRVLDTPSPFRAFQAAAQGWQVRFQILQRLPLVRRWLPPVTDPFYWRFLVWFDRWFPFLSDLRKSPDVCQFREALSNCALYYHVGMSGLNEFWEHGLIFKRWVVSQARSRAKLVVLSSQGLGPVSRPGARRQMKKLLGLADIVSLRDKEYSKNLLAELGLAQVATKVVFDEALSLAPAPEKATLGWLSKASLSSADSFIAFHYRETDYTQTAREPVGRVAEVLKLARAETGLRFLFVPMSYALHSRIDSDLGRKIAAQLSHPDWFHLLPECRDVRVIKAIVGRAKFSLGLSYHLHVFSLSQGILRSSFIPAVTMPSSRMASCRFSGLPRARWIWTKLGRRRSQRLFMPLPNNMTARAGVLRT
jgi:hypothetical protein